MANHFTVLASWDRDVSEQDVADLLFKNGCDDATVSFQRGELILDFVREALTIKEAVRSAIEDVTRSGFRVTGIRSLRDDSWQMQ